MGTKKGTTNPYRLFNEFKEAMGLELWGWVDIYKRGIHSKYIFCKKKGAIKPP